MFNSELSRYIVSGIANTVISYAAFVISLKFLSFDIYCLNLVSYAFGLVSAYFLNKYYVFKSSRAKSCYLFAIGFLFSYFVNLIILNFLVKFCNSPVEVAQFIAMAAYTVSFFTFNKLVVFCLHEESHSALRK
jgi:putative flippase GtrA